MNQYPEIFTRGVPGLPLQLSAEFRDSPRSYRPLRPSVRIKSPSLESKEVQAFSSFRRSTPPAFAEAETSTSLFPVQKVRSVAPTPAPLTNSILAKIGRGEDDLSIDLVPDSHLPPKHPPYRRPSPTLRSSAFRNAKVPTASFENEEIRGKVLYPNASPRPPTCTIRTKTARRQQTLVDVISITSESKEKTKVVQPLLRVKRHKSTINIEEKDGEIRVETVADTRVDVENKGFWRYKVGTAGIPPQFALPGAYSQALGLLIGDGEKKVEICEIAAGVLNLSTEVVSGYRFSYNAETMDYCVLTYGQNAPLSRCCSAPVLILLTPATGGKVLCTAWQCYIRNLHNFLLSHTQRVSLWSAAPQAETEPAGKGISMQIQTGGHRSRSLRSELRRRGKRKGSVASSRMSPDLLHPGSKGIVFTNDRLRHIRTRSDHSYAFDLKSSVTFQPPQSDRSLAISPIRRVLAKGGHRPGLTTSLEELETVWTVEAKS